MNGYNNTVKFFGLLLLLLGCSSQNSENSSLVLMLAGEPDSLAVTAYKVLDKPYQKNYQQGQYQIHLLNTEGAIIQKISFDKLTFGDMGSSDRIQLIVPMKSNFHKLALYKLDGSSGHYQLKDTQPLLSWKLPDKLREEAKTNSK